MKFKFQVKKFAAICLILLITAISSYSQEVIKIMPLGNSITEGDAETSPALENRIGYRYALYYKLLAAGYSFDFVGSQENGWARFPDYQHAGIPGSRDQYVARLLLDGYDGRYDVQILDPPRPYLDDFNPDIILLHIGTNDIEHEGEESDPDYPSAADHEQVSLILNRIDEYEARSGHEVIVFLALIINRKKPCYAGSGCFSTSQFNLTIKALAEARIAAGDKIVIVDMEHDAGFLYDDTDMQDHLHPSESGGYPKMAQLWLESIQNYYNTSPVISTIPDQTASIGGHFNQINLDSYVSDLEDIPADMTWEASVIGTPHFTVDITSERKAVVTLNEPLWEGSQEIIFTVTDSGNTEGDYIKSCSDTVLFTVISSGTPPSITGQDVLTVDEDNTITLNIDEFTVDDPDTDPEYLQLEVLEGSHYTFDGLNVTPEENYTSDLHVNIAASDLSDQGPTYEATIAITPENDAPEFTSTPPDSAFNGEYYIYIVTGKDVDNDELTIEVLASPSWLPYNSEIHSLVGKPTNDDVGNYDHVLISLTDGIETSFQDFYIRVCPSSLSNEEIVDEVLRIFPNPAIDRISIVGEFQSNDALFALFDANGRLVKKELVYKTDASTIVIENIDLLPGIYFYNITIDDLQYSGKLIIQAQ